MVKKLAINSNYYLLLDILDTGWCRVSLSDSSDIIYLGAEMYDTLKKKVMEGIQEFRNSKYKAEKKWIMSFSEQHYSIYIGFEYNSKFLYFMDDKGNFISAVELVNCDLFLSEL